MNRNASKYEWAGRGSPPLTGTLGTERKCCGHGKDLGASGVRI